MGSALEQSIRRTGLWLYQLIEEESPSVFRKEYWLGKVMDWCMRDEGFKVQMFRFVDVFPCLSRPESVARHFQEYFGGPDAHIPAALQWPIRMVPPDSLAAKMAVKSLTANLEQMAVHFIAGATPTEALPVLKRLRSDGMAFTVDLLGEAVVSEAEALEYQARYLDLLDILNREKSSWPALQARTGDADWGHSPRVNVSIKASAMYSQMNPRAFDRSVAVARERLAPVFRKAMETGAFVSLDMEQYSLKNLTLALYRAIMEEPGIRDYPHTGIVIQSYLRDSAQDLESILHWARKRRQRLTIRLVKGAYWDSEVVRAGQNNWRVPVFTDKMQTDASFERLARLILENHEWVRLACASHNIRSIAAVMETAKALRVPEDRLEYQILYGMGEPVRNALRKAGLPVRVYTPIGEMIQGMAYLVRRLLENTANESFLRKSFAEKVPREELLQNPADRIGRETAYRTDSRPREQEFGAAACERAVEEPAAAPVAPFRNEPLWDWSHAENRDSFKNALTRTRSRFPMSVFPVIGGRKIKTSRSFPSTNPNLVREVVGEIWAADPAQALQAVEAAQGAFPSWRDTPPHIRARLLFKVAAATRKMRRDLAALQVFEVGKNWSEADADVCCLLYTSPSPRDS